LKSSIGGKKADDKEEDLIKDLLEGLETSE